MLTAFCFVILLLSPGLATDDDDREWPEIQIGETWVPIPRVDCDGAKICPGPKASGEGQICQIDEKITATWLGDGSCDDGSGLFGANFRCPEFNWDAGDCSSTVLPTPFPSVPPTLFPSTFPSARPTFAPFEQEVLEVAHPMTVDTKTMVIAGSIGFLAFCYGIYRIRQMQKQPVLSPEDAAALADPLNTHNMEIPAGQPMTTDGQMMIGPDGMPMFPTIVGPDGMTVPHPAMVGPDGQVYVQTTNGPQGEFMAVDGQVVPVQFDPAMQQQPMGGKPGPPPGPPPPGPGPGPNQVLALGQVPGNN